MLPHSTESYRLSWCTCIRILSQGYELSPPHHCLRRRAWDCHDDSRQQLTFLPSWGSSPKESSSSWACSSTKYRPAYVVRRRSWVETRRHINHINVRLRTSRTCVRRRVKAASCSIWEASGSGVRTSSARLSPPCNPSLRRRGSAAHAVSSGSSAVSWKSKDSRSVYLRRTLTSKLMAPKFHLANLW